MRTRRLLALTCGLTAMCVACGHGDNTAPAAPPPPPPGPVVFSIESGRSGSDTIEALLGPALVTIAVRDTKAAPGVPVSYVVRRQAGPRTGLRIALNASSTFTDSISDTTRADGRSEVRIRLGTQAGPAYVVVAAPSLGFIDSAKFDVKPGPTIGVTVAPLDTAVFVGGTVKLRISAPDRAGNPTTNFSFQNFGGNLSSVPGDSNIHAGPTPARANIVVHPAWGGSGTNVFVTIVPRDTLMIERMDAALTNIQFVTMGLDGSGMNVIYPSSQVQYSSPGWLPDGRVIFRELFNIKAVTMTGVVTTLVPSSTIVAFQPRVSRAGDWIYFRGNSIEIWRARTDGSAPERLDNSMLVGALEPLPDGRLLAIQSDANTVFRFDPAARKYTSLGFTSGQMRVSPAGDRLAYITPDHNRLRISNLDGTGARDLLVTGFGTAQLSWTRDGNFVMVAYALNGTDNLFVGRYVLVNATTGEALPLPYTVYDGVHIWGEAAIKP